MSLQASERIETDPALGFDDVVLMPAMSYVGSKDVSLQTQFSTNIALNTPLVTAPDITDLDTAIHMAQIGGIGILPNTMAISKQADLVRQVKRFQSRIVRNVMTVTPETSIIEALESRQRYGIDVMPVIEAGTQVLAGFLIFDDAVEYDAEKYVGNYMSADQVLTVPEDTELNDAYQVMQENNSAYVAIVDGQNRCIGLITKDDKEKAEQFPHATIDANGALRVAAMVGTEESDFDRVSTLMEAGVDAIMVYADHAHSKKTLDMVTHIRRQRSGAVDVIVGNIATAQAALAFIDAGANGLIAGSNNAYKTLGMNVPQFSAILNTADAASIHNTPVISDGGATTGEVGKVFAGGAHVLMVHAIQDNEALMAHLRTAMSFTGCTTIHEFNSRSRFSRIT